MSTTLNYGGRSSGPSGIIASAPRPGTPTSSRPGAGAAGGGGSALLTSSMGYYTTAGTTNMGLDKNSTANSRYSTLLSYNRASYATPQKPGMVMTQGYTNAATTAEQACVTTRPLQTSRLGGTGRSSSIPASNRTPRMTKTPSTNYWDKQTASGSTTPRLGGTSTAWGASNAYGTQPYNTGNAAVNNNTQQSNSSTALAPNPSYTQRANTPGRGRLAYYSSNNVAANAYYSNTTNVNNNTMSGVAMGSVSNQSVLISNPQKPLRNTRVTLILDLDETLVHSSFDPIPADLHIPLVMDGEHYVAYVNKRPHLERFLARCVELFDVIVWTASLSVYAEPLINELCRMARCGSLKKMYREHCTEVAGGGYVKDLTTLGRSLEDVCILDNSPSVAVFQPNNLINIVSWYEDMNDTALLELFPLLESLASSTSIYHALPQINQTWSADTTVALRPRGPCSTITKRLPRAHASACNVR